MKNNSKIKKAMSSGIAPLIAIFSILFIILIYMIYSQTKPFYTEKEKNEMSREFIIEYFELEFQVTDNSAPAQNKEYIPTDTTYKKVEAYNSWAKSFETSDGKLNPDFSPITVEDVVTFSDNMQNFFDVMSRHDLLKKVIEDEMQGKYDYARSP